jgi:hypothetical protein
MYEAVNRAAREDGEPNTSYGRHTIRNWIGGVVPTSSDTLKWIAAGWGQPIDVVSAKADAHRTWRYELRKLRKTPELPPQHLQPRQLDTALTAAVVPQPGIPSPHEDSYPMMRRQFLQGLLSLGTVGITPEYLHGAAPAVPANALLFMEECAPNIRSCWRLMQGRDMVVVPSVLANWLPLLDTMLRQSGPYRRELAGLAAEGYMLGGLVAVLQNHLDRAEWFCRQAVDYATASAQPDLIVASLKHLATKYLDAGYPLLVLQTYERAIPHLDAVSPLLRGRTHLGLALAQVRVGNETRAERELAMAHATFPDRAEQDPAFVYADARRASLSHYGGLIHLAAGRAAQACETFGSALADSGVDDVPVRTVIEITNCQVEAAIALGDIELATTQLQTTALASRELHSTKRVHDCANLYAQLCARWPGDPRVKRIAPHFAASK